jgi:EAL domain-containing protein (putative c-di-GMP-specific phosphodiesterase class I)
MELKGETGFSIAPVEIVPYYQPLVDLKTGVVVGCEVLARWLHPERGVLLPRDFMHIIEASGTLCAVTHALLRRAITDARHWSPPLSLAINFSPGLLTEVRPAEELLQILIKEGFPPHRLELELTEETSVNPSREAKEALSSLRNLGIKIALDDFGTGFSNLSYFRDYEFDRVKIDKTFIAQMLHNPTDLLLVETIIGLCRTLDVATTGEGIESEEVARRLTQLGCELGQGFLFSEALPADQFSAFLEARSLSARKGPVARSGEVVGAFLRGEGIDEHPNQVP